MDGVMNGFSLHIEPPSYIGVFGFIFQIIKIGQVRLWIKSTDHYRSYGP